MMRVEHEGADVALLREARDALEVDAGEWEEQLEISLLAEQLAALPCLATTRGGAALYCAASDAELLELVEIHAAQARQVGAQQALLAGELARRSRHELGFGGLAQSLGHPTPEELIRVALSAKRSGRLPWEPCLCPSL